MAGGYDSDSVGVDPSSGGHVAAVDSPGSYRIATGTATFTASTSGSTAPPSSSKRVPRSVYAAAVLTSGRADAFTTAASPSAPRSSVNQTRTVGSKSNASPYRRPPPSSTAAAAFAQSWPFTAQPSLATAQPSFATLQIDDSVDVAPLSPPLPTQGDDGLSPRAAAAVHAVMDRLANAGVRKRGGNVARNAAHGRGGDATARGVNAPRAVNGTGFAFAKGWPLGESSTASGTVGRGARSSALQRGPVAAGGAGPSNDGPVDTTVVSINLFE